MWLGGRRAGLAAALALVAALSSACGGSGGGSTTYAISGTVSGATGEGVTVSLAGTKSATTTTDSSGGYAFSGLANGAYTVTPSKAGYSFAPASQSVTVAGANVTGKDFVASAAGTTYAISGTVSGATVEGVTVALSGASSATATTNASGQYSFSGLANGGYTVTPSKTGYTFAPASQSVTVAGANVTGRDFVAAPAVVTYVISGAVSGADRVTMTLIDVRDGGSRLVTTGSGGAYSFDGLADGTYVVTAFKTGYAFDPASAVVTVSGADATGEDFTAAEASGGTHAVTGTISGPGKAGVLITLTRTSTAGLSALAAGTSTTVTDAAGAFGFDVADGSYRITPSKAGFTFEPPELPVTVNGAGVAGTFDASALPGTFTISGTVSGAAGVSLELSGASTGFATTDAAGGYAFAGLENGSYTITPSKAGYTFNPASASATVNGADVGGKGFVAVPVPGTFTISGTVSGAVKAGVSVALTGARTAYATTDSEGRYSFGGLEPGNYSVTPTKAGHAFEPVSASGSVTDEDVTVPPFVAVAAPGGTFSISGTVSGAVKAGVEVQISQAGAFKGNTFTDAAGQYVFSGLLNGTYSVKPEKAGYSFTPAETEVTADGADVGGVNFTAASSGGVHAISGTVSGAWVEGVAVKLGGKAQAITATDALGRYRFEELADGTYTVEPALPGYAYAPPAPQVVLAGADAVQDFAASSVVPSFSISGTVTYAGALSGPVYLDVHGVDWSGQSWIAAPGAFTIRGLPAGEYKIQAFMDVYDLGLVNALVPQYWMEEYLAVSEDVSGVQIALQDMSQKEPGAPQLVAYPGNGSAVLRWMSSLETTTAFRISWGTDAAATNGGQATVGGRNNVYLVGGLTDGADYYFKICGLAGQVVGPSSDVVGPVTIGARTGGFTVSGQVSFPKSATGPLYVGLSSEQTYPPTAYLTRIANPVSPQAYSVSGLQAGRHSVFAAIDMNGDGVIQPGEPTNGGDVGGESMEVVISGDTALDLDVLPEPAQAIALTRGFKEEALEVFDVDLYVNEGAKRAVAVTLVSGRGLPLPCDLGTHATHGRSFSLGGPVPEAGDEYRFRVRYSDGSVETVTAVVTGVVGFAQDMSAVTAPPQSPTVPLFTWADPVSPPAAFSYRLEVAEWLGPMLPGLGWTYPGDDWMPSSQHEVAYNEDGYAQPPELTAGSTYHWAVTVRDGIGNMSTRSASYTP